MESEIAIRRPATSSAGGRWWKFSVATDFSWFKIDRKVKEIMYLVASVLPFVCMSVCPSSKALLEDPQDT